MPSLDTIFADLSALGWQVSNLYQTNDGWRVNLHRPTPDGTFCGDYSIAPTLIEALEDAMSKLHDAEFFADSPKAFSIDTSRPNLLEAIGLAPKAQPINRRF